MADETTSQWYWAKDGTRGGPVTWEELQSMARTGKLRASDLVCRVGAQVWQPASSARADGQASVAAMPVSSADIMPDRPRMSDEGLSCRPYSAGGAIGRRLLSTAFWVAAMFVFLLVSHYMVVNHIPGAEVFIAVGLVSFFVRKFLRVFGRLLGD